MRPKRPGSRVSILTCAAVLAVSASPLTGQLAFTDDTPGYGFASRWLTWPVAVKVPVPEVQCEKERVRFEPEIGNVGAKGGETSFLAIPRWVDGECVASVRWKLDDSLGEQTILAIQLKSPSDLTKPAPATEIAALGRKTIQVRKYFNLNVGLAAALIGRPRAFVRDTLTGAVSVDPNIDESKVRAVAGLEIPIAGVEWLRGYVGTSVEDFGREFLVGLNLLSFAEFFTDGTESFPIQIHAGVLHSRQRVLVGEEPCVGTIDACVETEGDESLFILGTVDASSVISSVLKTLGVAG